MCRCYYTGGGQAQNTGCCAGCGKCPMGGGEVVLFPKALCAAGSGMSGVGERDGVWRGQPWALGVARWGRRARRQGGRVRTIAFRGLGAQPVVPGVASP